ITWNRSGAGLRTTIGSRNSWRRSPILTGNCCAGRRTGVSPNRENKNERLRSKKERWSTCCLAALRMKDRRTHSLPSFSAWLNKGFDLRQHAAEMKDARLDPDISPTSVFLALFHGFVFRLPSFQQLDSELAHSYL